MTLFGRLDRLLLITAKQLYPHYVYSISQDVEFKKILLRRIGMNHHEIKTCPIAILKTDDK